MSPIETFHWNPIRPRFRGPIGRRIPVRGPLNNFGDLLGPIIVNEILRREHLNRSTHIDRRLLSVGSILHFAADGDIVWGSGVNGKVTSEPLRVNELDVRSVRGPLTRDFLHKNGIDCPPNYGDPGLLMSWVWPDLKPTVPNEKPTVLMNFNDRGRIPRKFNIIDPRRPVLECIERLAASSLVVGSSLHAIVVAESYGIPARLVRSQHEPAFKYDDYYAGTGRESYAVATSIEEAIEMGGEVAPTWSPADLLRVFPRDLWAGNDAHSASDRVDSYE